jgi:hypothetical protein
MFSANVAHGKWETMNQMRELLVRLGCKLGNASLSSSSSSSNGSHNKRRRLSLDSSTRRRSLSTTLSGTRSSGFSNSWGSMMAPISRARSHSFEERRSSFKELTFLRERSENTTSASKDSSILASYSRCRSKSISSPSRQIIVLSQPLPYTGNSLISTPPHNVSKSPCHLNVSTKSALSLDQISKSEEADPLRDYTNQTYSSSVYNTIVSQHTMYKSPIHTQEQEQDACTVPPVPIGAF